METWIPIIILLISIILLVIFIFSMGWFIHHPWPGSTREELDEQMRRTFKEHEHQKHA